LAVALLVVVLAFSLLVVVSDRETMCDATAGSPPEAPPSSRSESSLVRTAPYRERPPR
jgi:hypothetical protein